MQGRYDEAEMLYVEALATARRAHGAEKDHPDIATSLNNLALLYKSQLTVHHNTCYAYEYAESVKPYRHVQW